MADQKHIWAAMSGGVDSSVMAHLLLRAGYRVTGATMRLYRPETAGGEVPCGSEEDVADARSVCDALGIPHQVLDMGETFQNTVIADFVSEYEAGRTPNPCIVCNRHLKFGALLDAALAAGADGLATGHYARVSYDPGSGRHLLLRAVDTDKDQSYVLWSLSQAVLSRVILPLGEWHKPDIRALSAELALVTAHKSDSQDICFVPDGDYAAFLHRYTGKDSLPGEYVTEEGKVLGTHKGVRHYTVGQRKGLGIALGQPMFVKSKDPVTRRVVLTTNDRLFADRVTVSHLNLIALERLTASLRCQVKIRYGQVPCPATVHPCGDGSAVIVFDTPQRAPAPGQSAVFYDGDVVIGGGIMDEGTD